MSIHTANACIVSCIDFRFQEYIKKWLSKNMKNKAYDYVGFAGATKDLHTIKERLAISIRLHQISQVVLIHHEDCGAYGKEDSHDRHAKDLKKAQEVINALYPELKISLYYLHLNGKFELIK